MYSRDDRPWQTPQPSALQQLSRFESTLCFSLERQSPGFVIATYNGLLYILDIESYIEDSGGIRDPFGEALISSRLPCADQLLLRLALFGFLVVQLLYLSQTDKNGVALWLVPVYLFSQFIASSFGLPRSSGRTAGILDFLVRPFVDFVSYHSFLSNTFRTSSGPHIIMP